MTRQSHFSKLFSRSPFKPMQEHMRVVVRCAGEVTGLFEALCDGDFTRLGETRDRIFTLESEADRIKNELRAHLPKSLLMPVDRRDLLEILDMQDSIADTAQDISGLLVERRMEVPEVMRVPLLSLVGRCIDACNLSAAIIEELDELVATGFRGPESGRVSEMVDELNTIESDTDAKATDLTRVLFAQEAEMNPVSVVFWYQLIQWVGDLADYAEKVGDRLRLLMAR